MTEDDIALEYEMHLASEGKILKTCYKCSATTHRDACAICGIELSGDATMDDIFARIEAGENVDLDKALRGEKWEPVTFDEGEQ